MNLMDSSGWIEYFLDGPNASFFNPAICQTDALLVPTICLYEVYKRIAIGAGQDAALQAIVQMKKGKVVSLGDSLSIHAAQISLKNKLPMADSIIYATALSENATIWTQDEHFKDRPNVKFIAPQK